MEINIFWRHFLLNKMTCFVQNNALSCTVQKKKKTITVSFQTTLYIFFFPNVQRQGNKVFLPLLCSTYIPSFSFSPLVQTLTQLTPLTCHHDEDWIGKLYSAAEATAQRPPQPPYLVSMIGQRDRKSVV